MMNSKTNMIQTIIPISNQKTYSDWKLLSEDLQKLAIKHNLIIITAQQKTKT